MKKLNSARRTKCAVAVARAVARRPLAESLERRVMMAATLPAGFTESLIATGLASPTAMEFAPDGRVFVAQQDGNVRVVQNDQLLAAPFVTLPADTTGERGLMGVVADPNFVANKYLYVYYTTAAGTGESHNRVSRFTAAGNTAALAGETVILDLPAIGGGAWHMGGAMRFGLDGKLYVAVGDYEFPANAQSMTTPAGKLLRINPDGSIPTDNPFYASTTGVNKAIWALGLRNPFTLAVQPVTGRMYVADVGQSGYEEVDEGKAGANYGWPGSEGPTTIAGYTPPVYAYTHAEGVAVVGGAFYQAAGGSFPSQYAGQYFFGDFGGGWVRTIDPATKQASAFGSGMSFITGVAAGADGNLWYLSRGAPSGGLPNTGSVFKIAYNAFQPPKVNEQPVDLVVSVGDAVTFRVAASGGGTVTYQWSRNGAAVAGATTNAYSLAGTTTADSGARFACTVTNAYGTVTTRQAVLTVTTNKRPVPTILAPAAGTTFAGGQTVAYAASATDAEDGALPASAFTWQINYYTGAVARPFLLPTSGAKTGTFVAPVESPYTEADVYYRVTLTVTDSTGLSATTYADIKPRTAALTLTTNVPGAKVEIDGQPKATPYVTVGVEGLRRSVGAAPVQTVNGETWQFDHWSDGGDATHAVTFPGAATTLTAVYRKRQVAFASDLPFAGTPTNKWGPVERDLSNGEAAAGDGKPIALNGVVYPKGFGVHADSEITIDLGGKYDSFLADVGLDDEVGNAGTVVFQVWADGAKLFDSGLMIGEMAARPVNVDVRGKQQLKLVAGTGGDDGTFDHADWAGARLVIPEAVVAPPAPPAGAVYASDLAFMYAPSNGWGPVERDAGNGEAAAGDGGKITLAGVAYAKGIGTHANAEVNFDLAGAYASFHADVGIDDEEGDTGSAIFQLWGDGVKLYDSGILYGSSATRAADVSVAGVQRLALVTTDAGDNNYNDHADWAGATLTPAGAAPTPPTPPAPTPVPSAAVANVRVVEGNGGTTSLVFTVTRSSAASASSVAFATADGTATVAGGDYSAASGTLAFAAGELSKTVSVSVFGDTKVEADETLSIVLSAPTNLTLPAGRPTGTIANDDLPTVAVADATVTEGNAGTVDLAFVVTRSDGLLASAVNWATASGTASAGSDYAAASGTLAFAAGEMSKTIVVKVTGDAAVEANETVLVTLSSPTAATIARGQATGTIVNDDAAATFSVANATAAEGSSGTRSLAFAVTRSSSAGAATVQWSTANGSATTADGDYVAASGTVSFAAGETSKTVNVTVNGDARVEADETFVVNLSNPSGGGGLARPQAVGTIVNDDVAPIVFQAESAALRNTSVSTANSGYTGSGYAAFKLFGSAGDAITWSPSVAVAGTRTLQIRYSSGTSYNSPSFKLVVNGVTVFPTVSFPSTGSARTWAVVSLTVSLAAGVNSVSLVSNGGLFSMNVDSLTVS